MKETNHEHQTDHRHHAHPARWHVLGRLQREARRGRKAVDETGKAGKVTITLDLKKSGGALAISAKVTTKAPEAKADEDLLWPTLEGNLSLDNPNQRKLDLQIAPSRPAEVRSVDPATGEITVKSA